MTKATRILNDLQIEYMLMNSENIDFTKFYNVELIRMLEISHKIIKEYKKFTKLTPKPCYNVKK